MTFNSGDYVKVLNTSKNEYIRDDWGYVYSIYEFNKYIVDLHRNGYTLVDVEDLVSGNN